MLTVDGCRGDRDVEIGVLSGGTFVVRMEDDVFDARLLERRRDEADEVEPPARWESGRTHAARPLRLSSRAPRTTNSLFVLR